MSDAAVVSVTCALCGGPVPAGQRTCPNCGARMDVDHSAELDSDFLPTSASAKRAVLFGALPIGIYFVSLGLIWLLSIGSSEDSGLTPAALIGVLIIPVLSFLTTTASVVLAAVFGFKGLAETRNHARPGRSRAILGIVLAGGTVLVAIVFFFVAIIAVVVGVSPPDQL